MNTFSIFLRVGIRIKLILFLGINYLYVLFKMYQILNKCIYFKIVFNICIC